MSDVPDLTSSCRLSGVGGAVIKSHTGGLGVVVNNLHVQESFFFAQTETGCPTITRSRTEGIGTRDLGTAHSF